MLNGNILFSSIRIYPNGDRRYNAVKPEHLIGHIHYNERWRFGCDLFIDGKLAVKSVVYKDTEERRERLRLLEEQIQKENWKPTKCNAPYS